MSDTKLLTKSKPESTRRLEVFTGSGRAGVGCGAESTDRRRDLGERRDGVGGCAAARVDPAAVRLALACAAGEPGAKRRERRAVRQDGANRSRPHSKPWLELQLSQVLGKTLIAEAIALYLSIYGPTVRIC